MQISHSDSVLERVVIDSLEVHSKCEGDTALVSSGVSSANGDATVINLVADTSLDQHFLQLSRLLVKTGVVDQREDNCLDGSYRSWECKVGTLSILRADVEAMLEDAIDDTANTV